MFEAYYQEIETQVRGREVRKIIWRVRERYPVFRKYQSVDDLVALVQPENRNFADKDEVLGILLSEVRTETRLLPMFDLMFWKGIVGLYNKKFRVVSDVSFQQACVTANPSPGYHSMSSIHHQEYEPWDTPGSPSPLTFAKAAATWTGGAAPGPNAASCPPTCGMKQCILPAVTVPAQWPVPWA